ncbi:MAG: hypothetical protein ACRC2R_11590 [Xenococcaceae cyanobacterium]
MGIVFIEKTYNWHIHAVIVRPLAWLTPTRKNDQDEKPMSQNDTPIPQFIKDKLEQQQQELELRDEVETWGIKCRDKDWKQIIKHGVEKVREGLNHLLIRATSTEIHNPVGWMRKCIQEEWWLDRPQPMLLSPNQLAYG